MEKFANLWLADGYAAESKYFQNERKERLSMNESGGGAGFAITSMVLGIVALVTSCCIPYLPALLALLGVIFAGVSLSGKKAGKGMAIAGLVCSIISLVPTIIVIVSGAALMSSLGL